MWRKQQVLTKARRAWSCVGARLVLMFLVGRVCLAGQSSLEESFLNPPDSAKPWVHWFWLDGNITAEGITADLESMARTGIGGAVLMDITHEVPPGPVAFGGPEWTSLFRHALGEAHRLGLQLSMNNDAGWSGSGGPWITPELSMQKLVWTKTNVVGPSQVQLLLPRLPTFRGFARDVATLAFPSILGDGAVPFNYHPQIRAVVQQSNNPLIHSSTIHDLAKVSDGNPATSITLPNLRPGRPQYIELVFPRPFSAAQLTVTATAEPQPFKAVLEFSKDGRNFVPLRQFSTATGNATVEFEEVSAQHYRIGFLEAAPYVQRLKIAEVLLSPMFRLPDYQAKSGMGRQFSGKTLGSALPTNAFVLPKNVVDLSASVDGAGRLTWSVPTGNWTILRLGHMPTGRENPPARAGGLGLECDKLNQEAAEVHFQGLLAKLIAAVGGENRKALTFTHIDSWEVGFQNWTPRFREEFQRRRGYDPLPYLPAATGRVVGSSEVSERFLWDFRRTLAELEADNYAGHLAKLAHEHGLKLSIEAYGNGPFDNLLYASRADVPMSEFWNETDDYEKFHTSKSMASAAHTYSKPVVAAEAFTAWPVNGKWQNAPGSLKWLADTAFAYGVNRIVFHRFAHQPWLDLQPGMTMGMWGIHYDRTETWWELSGKWHRYLARCQYLLQQGLFAADVCYLTQEGSFAEPQLRRQLNPGLPEGYDYDLITPEAVLTRMTVKEGRLVLPDGMSYAVLVLPPWDRATPALLHKIKELLQAGAVVVGPKPLKSPSLESFPRCDDEVRRLAAELWQNCDGTNITEAKVGQGQLFWGEPLERILASIKTPPDFRQLTPTERPLRWLHRRFNDQDFYFVANPNRTPVVTECQFRVTGKRPELWFADSGRIAYPGLWRAENSHTTTPLHLEPFGSVFVVFRESSTNCDPAVSLQRGSQSAPDTRLLMGQARDSELTLVASQPGEYTFRTASGKTLKTMVAAVPPLPLDGSWRVRFPPNLGAPPEINLSNLVSWTDHAASGVKYFSGTAVYERSFDLASSAIAPDQRLLLDLGRVEVIASVTLNGQSLGVLWQAPYVADITASARPGNNSLVIAVANLWPNRLIGDEHLPEDCSWRSETPGAVGTPLVEWPAWLTRHRPRPSGRIAFATRKFYTRDSPLLPSGLLGPVAVRFETRVELRP